MTLFDEPFSCESPYFVLARRYRPQLFSEVVGQDLFVRMIKSALKQNRLAHGLMLTGIRGIGKTTLARLIAKAFLCHDRQEEEPCGICPSCQALQEDKHVDVIEMDAASHTGVEDIRSVIEACHYRAVMGDHRIYIIDEVHMLSKNAFNALLKTLEEPPSHVKFILATTESTKVPATIISRCQLLHLTPLSVDTLSSYLSHICEKEGMTAEKEALAFLASAAQGGARNALSLLEQALLMIDDRTLLMQDVHALLGLVHQETIESLWASILQKDHGAAIQRMRFCQEQGHSARALWEGLLDLLHRCMIDQLRHPAEKESIDISHLWQIAHHHFEDCLASSFPYRALEMRVLRMIYASTLPSPEALLKGFESPCTSLSTRESLMPDDCPVKAEPTFSAFLEYVEGQREGILTTYLMHSLSFVSWEKKKLVLCWIEQKDMPSSLQASLEKMLRSFTGRGDTVVFCKEKGQDPVHLQQMKTVKDREEKALSDPLVQQAYVFFKDAVLEEMRQI